MAQRAAGKANKKSPKKAGGGKRRAASSNASRGRGAAQKASANSPKAADFEAECVRLRAEVATAKSRIETLEGRQAEVLNRLDWAIDSLQNAIDDENT